MHTVYGTYGRNRKENEIEKEVLDQVKFEEAVPNIHLWLSVDLFHLASFFTDLLFVHLGGFRPDCEVFNFLVVYFEALNHSLLVNILFKNPLNGLLNFFCCHSLFFKIFISYDAVRGPLGMLLIKFWFGSSIDSACFLEMLVSLDRPSLWEVKLKCADMLLQFQIKILLLRRPNFFDFNRPFSRWLANLILQLVEIPQALVVCFVIILVREHILVMLFGDVKEPFGQCWWNVLAGIFTSLWEPVACHSHFDILHRFQNLFWFFYFLGEHRVNIVVITTGPISHLINTCLVYPICILLSVLVKVREKLRLLHKWIL